MKKTYKTLITGAVLSLLSVNLSAQLSGTVTVNSASPTSGTNYQTFSALAATLNVSGVNGPLVVNVVANSGPYVEQVMFNQMTGVSATNTITINGNGCTLTFTSAASAAPHTLVYNGADYITLNNLNVVGNGGTYALVCHLWNGANNNTFNNCTFTAPFNGTSTTQVPFSLSGTGTSGTASGNSGNNNTVNSCTMTGGYYNTVLAGSTTAPFNTGNTVINSVIRDFYLYGMYNLYCQGTTIKGNIVDRLNRTSVSTTYAIYLSTGSTANELVEGNHVRNLFNNVVGSTSTAYGIYITADASPGNENIIRNNVVSNINSNGTIYGIYLSGSMYAWAYHNTISLDDQTATAGTTYGIYCSGPYDRVRNNIVTVTRTGSGTKYGLYYTTAASALISDDNVVYVNVAGGYTGYLGSAYLTMNDWKLGNPGLDQGSLGVNPVYTNTAALNYVPTSTVINNTGDPIGVLTDFNNTPRSLVMPDPGAFEMFNTPCTGTPGVNSFVTPTVALCPNTSISFELLNSNTYTYSGVSIQWQSSTVSPVGPFTSISGATLNSLTTPPINTSTWYNAVITCTNSNGSYVTATGSVIVAPTTTNTVPYYEGFETLAPNRLPNCSWSASNMGGSTLTYTTINSNNRYPHGGNNFASFASAPAGNNYFYTNGIYLKPGITYSAALWYVNEAAGYNGWSEISILVGSSQSPSGLMMIASHTNAAAVSYKLLSDTFKVTTAGLYYLAIRGTPAPGASPYLSWDDLSVTIPCQYNSPSISLFATASTVCAGQPVAITASGADTYTWSTGANSPQITVTPTVSGTYSVAGTKTLSGCASTIFKTINVLTAPQVLAVSNNSAVCKGSGAILTAYGADTYNWSNGSTGSITAVTPTGSSTYTVMGVNSIGCAKAATVMVTVNPLPVVTVPNSNTMICAGESITVTAGGANSYQWSASPGSIMIGNPMVLSPSSSAVYTITGTDTKGCSASVNMVVAVNECTGLTENISAGLFRIFPNPANSEIRVELPGSEQIKATVYDSNMRLLSESSLTSMDNAIDVSQLPAGMYYLQVNTGEASSMVKFVKVN